MNPIGISVFTRFQYFISKIYSFLRIYHYKDFHFYHTSLTKYDKVLQEQKDSHLIHTNQQNDTLQYHFLQSTDSINSINNATHNTQSHHFEHTSFQNPNQSYLDKIYALSTMEFYVPSSLQKKSAFMLWFLRFFQQEFCVLSPDSLHSAEVEITKEELQEQEFMDTFVLLKAHQLKLIAPNQEYSYFVKNMTKQKVSFQIFYVSKEILQKYTMQTTYRIYFLNPFTLFCSLNLFYPNLTHYTIIFQDKNSHALCHYTQGILDFSVIIERKEDLQKYYTKIAILGEILYCDWSGEREYLHDFISIESLFHAPLHKCLKILATHQILMQPIQTNFFLKDFYALKTKVKILLWGSAFTLGFFACHILFEKYQYYHFVEQQERQYYTQIEKQYHKKQIYTPMYDRIYEHLLKTKSFNFHFKQEYKNGEWHEVPTKD